MSKEEMFRRYDKAVENELINNYNVPAEDAHRLMSDYYPVVTRIHQREVEPQRYARILSGIHRQNKPLAEVKDSISKTLGIKFVEGNINYTSPQISKTLRSYGLVKRVGRSNRYAGIDRKFDAVNGNVIKQKPQQIKG
ncbi:hypothetical protein DFQ01_10534 [Paenibacillus cellulosilyticus]|uniref:Uncharacterized protein n=1 Tax=Paenibacillus cellulosilyticus TaxID=375489 RepID=A0A2V2YVP9_9BACL|nr:hypothetical protein [Paenibacillus cellulosilyticus]PWW05051.1 hypothetical protein DFQ01_10534 [Paenibacillus cellulosilyticus]QKS48608.1 hypothetical protein HUB94_30840 [Paenibacillus cellulosilyticus]